MASALATSEGAQQGHEDTPGGVRPRKAFIPLGETTLTPAVTLREANSAENNPEVMTTLLRDLGLSPKLAFHDVFSIDDPDLIAFVPRPAYALLLVFPVSRTYEDHRRAEDADRPEYEGKGAGEEVMWFKQTIRNACGLIGLLHGVANGEARGFVGALHLPLYQNCY